MNETPSEILDMDVAGLADWNIRLAGDTWILGRAHASMEVPGAPWARMRIARQGTTHLLVGGNGHPSLLSAIAAARGGETILVAPGVYREERAVVIDRAVTLQGVSRLGTPIGNGGEVLSTIVAPCNASSQGLTIAAPGVVIQGLAFVSRDRHSSVAPAHDMGNEVQLLNAAGQLQNHYAGIQPALDAAREGDRLLLPPGSHVGDLHIRKAVTLAGTNAGRPGHLQGRGAESTLLGRIHMGCGASRVTIDGMVLRGSFVMKQTAADRRLALRNCLIDGRNGYTAISLTRGTESEIINNLILGGSAEGIFIGRGFDDLSICGNRFETAKGAVGIALCGGSAPSRIQIVGNTFLDGDYGVLIEGEKGVGQPGDEVVLSGNHFGESCRGLARRAPAVAAVHAEGPFPSWLKLSMGAPEE